MQYDVGLIDKPTHELVDIRFQRTCHT